MKFNFNLLIFEEQNISPEKIAIMNSSLKISWEQLELLTLELSLLLQGIGLAKGAPIFISTNQHPLEVVAILACQICGLTYVPIPHQTPIGRALEMKEILSSDFLIDCSNSNLPFGNVISFSDKWFLLKQCNLNFTKSLLKSYLYIIFTSGSTGTPKAVPITKENLAGFVKWFETLNIRFNSEDIFLNPFLFSFDGSQPSLNFILNCGGSIILAQKNDDLDKMMLSEVTICFATSSWYQNAMRFKDFNFKSLNKLKTILIGGEMLNSYVVTKLRHCFPESTIWNLYGPTETTVFVSALELNESICRKYKEVPLTSLSKLGPMRIVNEFSEDEQKYGEIEIHGDVVSDGYLNSTELTEKFFYTDAEGNSCFKTNDIVKIEDEFVFFAGRNDSQIKLGGFRVDLAEVESLVYKTGLVSNCSCVPIFREGLPRRLILFFVPLKSDNTTIKKDIHDYLSRFLIPQLIPSEIHTVNEIPTTQNFKVDQNELLRRYSSR